MRHPELAILSHHTTIFTTDARFAVHIFPRSGVVELRIHKVVVALNFSPFFLPLLNFLFMLPPPFLPYFCPWILTALAALYLPWLGSDGVEFRAFQTKPTWPTFLTHPPDLLIHHGGLNTEKIKRQNIYQSKKSGVVWSLHWRLKCFLGCMEAFDKFSCTSPYPSPPHSHLSPFQKLRMPLVSYLAEPASLWDMWLQVGWEDAGLYECQAGRRREQVIF